MIRSPYEYAGALSSISGALTIIVGLMIVKPPPSSFLLYLGSGFLLSGLVMLMHNAKFANHLKRLKGTGVVYPAIILSTHQGIMGFKISGFRCFYVICSFCDKDGLTRYAASRLLCARKDASFLWPSLSKDGNTQISLTASVYVNRGDPNDYAVFVVRK